MFQAAPGPQPVQNPPAEAVRGALAGNAASAKPFDYLQLHTDIAALLAKDLFFVGAHPKSGSTWLQVMLDAHPEISCGGEGHFINRFAPLLKSALQTHGELIARKNATIFQGFKPFPNVDNQVFSYLVASCVALTLRHSGNDPQVRVVGEKTPDNVLHFVQLAALFPRAKFLHVIRDGRDCTISTWFHNLRINPGDTQRRYPTLDDFIAPMAKSWRAHVERGLRFGATRTDRCLAVRYEDMVAHPRESMRAVFRFLGVDTSFAVLRRCLEQGQFETMSGGRKPGVEDRGSFLRQGLPGNWRKHLSPEANKAFLEIAGDVMKRIGYQP